MKPVLSIGNFDGLHLGHQFLLSRVKKLATELNAQSRVVSFHPHPMEFLFPKRAPMRIFDLAEQEKQILNFGIDHFTRLNFDLEFSKLSALEFFQNYILQKWHPQALVVGHDFRFGHDRQGDGVFLEKHCKENGIYFEIMNPFQVESAVVSSSMIRNCLQQADLVQAEKYLGKKYFLQGEVVRGSQRGSQLLVPTANLKLAPELKQNSPLKKGVYAVVAEWQKQKIQGVMNLGRNPTVSETEILTEDVKIEVHLFNFKQDIYGQKLKVTPIKYLRQEIKFNSLEELKKQIQIDIEIAKEALA